LGLRLYIFRRIVVSFVLILSVITVDFIICVALPGRPMDAYVFSLKGRITKERYDALAKHFGLDKPLYEQYLINLRNLITWDFGQSWTGAGQGICEEIINKLLNTILLLGPATILSIIIGIFLGTLCAYKKGSFIDTILTLGSMAISCVPSFFFAWIILFIFTIKLGWFPSFPLISSRETPPNVLEIITQKVYCSILPMVTLVLFSVGGWILFARACVLETITEDYVITARAKGLGELTVLYKHVLKNASLPLITYIALSFGFMVGGAIIVETIFNYDGMGLLIWNSIQGIPDLPMLYAIFYVLAICVIMANFIADLLYGIIDPRIRYG